MSYLQLAIPSPLRRLFDYRPPRECSPEQLSPGVRVKVPFGRREVTGILINVTQHSEVPPDKLKPAIAVLDTTPPMPESILKLARWAANYYQHPLGDALSQALPVLLRKGDPCEYAHQHLWRSTPDADIAQLGKTAARQRELLLLLLEHPNGISEDAIRAEGGQTPLLKKLADKGLAESFIHNTDHHQHNDQPLHEAPLTLNTEQQLAVNAITATPGFKSFLLQGVTGSGKTEVYLQAIEHFIRQGKQALILVPEIGLTPQTVARFKARFNLPVVVLHSNLTDRQRLDTWLQAREGTARIIIGTRSAIFTPLKNPGVIFIDEEHDTSFKQQDGFRYNARDLAVMRANFEQIPVVLGTATPAIESLYNAQQGRYHWLKLNQRAGNARAPEFELLDIRQQPLQDGLSAPLVAQIKHHLQQGTQVLIFLNRRGFAPTLMCHDCGWLADCKRCDAHMTLHRKPFHLHCHHCDSQRPVPIKCDSCGSTELKPVGAGTERTEEALQKLFPSIPVIRVDRDTTQRKNAMQQIMDRVHQGLPCILIGTQMLAKGHHFPKVTLVAILNADSGLFSADFRGMERTAQLILQVAGRAGRADHPGKVVMQTHHADHPTITSLVTEGYQAFAEQELGQRIAAHLPPSIHCAMLRAEASHPGAAERFLGTLRNRLESDILQPQGVQWLGPLPSPMEKRAGLFRAQLVLQCRDRKNLHQQLHNIIREAEGDPDARKVRWSVDVDPVDMF
ncbi:replication restart DNA helicase PriA [Amphritea atlantica]|uniref:Replication restart protein PriA n=1 Tax=Amphritea atlantica TaxID=355243 RepID=A0A1H9ESH5_9GAMM|nr:primosomal protein N' [Amphritea atlantica]SEQ28552.1 replication restart DNA helicase PriA [Amphritea atlantica]